MKLLLLFRLWFCFFFLLTYEYVAHQGGWEAEHNHQYISNSQINYEIIGNCSHTRWTEDNRNHKTISN